MKSGRIGRQESDLQSFSSLNEEYNAIKTKSKSKSKALSSSMNIKMLDDNGIESRCSSFSADETEYIVFSFRKNGEFNISMNENFKRSDSSEVDRIRHINHMEEDEESQYMDSLSLTTEIEIEEDIEEDYEHDDEMTLEEISSSKGNKRSSFAFPALESLWIGSPVKMPESVKHLRKERFWKLGLHLCCKF